MNIKRLTILKEANVIDDETFNKVKKIIETVSEKFAIELENDQGYMFTTHVAMAIMRIKKQEPTNHVETAVYEEIKESDNYETAAAFADYISDIIQYEIPENEYKYFVINGCLLLENQ